MSRRRILGIAFVVFPFIGLAMVLAISAYSGCEIQDRPFAFLGDECYKNGIYWNKIAAPLGILSLAWLFIGPAIWIAYVILKRIVGLAKTMLGRDQ
jgi:hypothetical protein